MQAEESLYANVLSGARRCSFWDKTISELELRTIRFCPEICRKFGSGSVAPDSYSRLFETAAGENPEPALAWMHEVSRKFSPPEWLRIVGEYAWNAIYTSAIDVIWMSAFRTVWREVQPIFNQSYIPSDPRNPLTLHATMLFGSISRVDANEAAPLSRVSWLRRKQTATSLMLRLPEVVSPLGTLMIEGFDPRRDWVSFDDFLPLVDRLQIDQVHWFSVNDDLGSHPDVQIMLRTGKLVIHSTSLAAFLLSGQEQGFLPSGQPKDVTFGRRNIRLGESGIPVPSDVWNQAARSASVLDIMTTASPGPLSTDAEYQAFRNFLSTSDGRPQWSGYGRGFAFQRDFEGQLRLRVEDLLGQKRLSDRPLLLHGPTATGKTVALAGLAYTTAKRGIYPVVFIERKTRRPVGADIDRFCQWAEDAGGATKPLVVWDGMIRPEEYGDFLRHLSGRGRKVGLVGSCYKLADADSKSRQRVEAPAELTESELARFASFLVRFHPDLAKIGSRWQVHLVNFSLKGCISVASCD